MPRESVAEFDIERVQVLAEDGSVDEELLPPLADEELLSVYEAMKRSRRLDKRAIALQRRGELGTYAPAIGQEAAQVGSAFALGEDDWVVPSFREQAALMVRGVPPAKILQYALGMEEGAEIPGGEGALPPAIPVGSQPLHAAGVGWGEALQGRSTVAMAYFGDGATSQGDVYEAFNFAGVYDAQTVFLCQNNQYAISTHLKNQTEAETLAQKAIAAGIEGVQVDGNDVLGVYHVVREAVDRARNGEPVLVEALTYRRSMHTTSDDPSAYRTADEEAEWEARDPILRLQQYLEERGVLNEEVTEAVDERIESDIAEAIETAREAEAAIDPADMFEHVYEEMPPYLRRQRETFRAGDVGGDAVGGSGGGNGGGGGV